VTYDADDRGVESSQPREGFEFVLPAVTYRLTSAARDIVINGQTYRAGTIERGAAEFAVAGGQAGELEISLVATHPIAQRCLSGLPPRIDVNVYSKQLTSGEYQLVWSGLVVAVNVERHIVKLLVSQRLGIARTRRLPTITVGRQCAHVLYDQRCTVDRNAFRVDTSIALVNGRTITVDGIDGQSDQWALFGELFHVASGERITITKQIGTALELQLPIPGMQAEDAVQIYAGCAHDIDTCRTKFANHVNFGGLPDLPSTNPFTPNGYSVFRPVY